jgi:competence ComEA-like helix-hairpin-helix protein
MEMKKNALVWIAWILAISLVLGGTISGQTKTLPKASAPAKVDLNKATAEQLLRCPGLTLTLAKAIVEYRAKAGPFKTPEDLLKVKGMTKEILSKVNPKVEKDILYIVPAGSDEDEEEPSLKPSKC